MELASTPELLGTGQRANAGVAGVVLHDAPEARPEMSVERWGGVMAISVAEGQHHIAATWKDDNLRVENYDPKPNTCVFMEYSRGNLLQGRVLLKDCEPLALWLGKDWPNTSGCAGCDPLYRPG